MFHWLWDTAKWLHKRMWEERFQAVVQAEEEAVVVEGELFIAQILGDLIADNMVRKIPPIVLIMIGGLVGRGLLKRFNQYQQQKNETRIALARLYDIDPNFDEDDFLNKLQDIFLHVQQAWSSRDMRSVEDVETPELFRLHQSQLEMYDQKNWTPHVETKRITEVRFSVCFGHDE